MSSITFHPSSMRASLLAMTLLAAPLAAQTPALRVDGRLLPQQADTFAIYLVRGTDTVPAGSVFDIVLARGDTLLRYYSEDNRLTGPQIDTITSLLPGLQPLRYRSASHTRLEDLWYDHGSVHGTTVLSNGEPDTVRVALPAEVYDGASFDLVVRASPLAEGFTLTVPSFVAGPNAVVPISGRVTRADSVDGRACWVFQANFAGEPVTFWIDKANRALLRQFLRFSADGGILFTRLPLHRRSARAT